MKRLITCYITILLCTLPLWATAENFQSIGTIDAYFSPHGGATEAIVDELNSAKQHIMVQAYSFTSNPIAKALIQAQKRGVKVEVILDRSQLRDIYTAADFISHAGIPTYIDTQHTIAHNKIIIIDHGVLITGSFNFTKAAEESNAENLLILRGNKPLVDRYIMNFEEHKGHSDLFK